MGGQGGGLLFKIAQFRLQFFQPILGRLIGFLFQGLAFDLQLDDAPIQFVDGFWFAVDFHAQARRGLIHKVNRLIRQEPVGDIAIGQGSSRDNRRIGDANPVVKLILFLQATQDRNCVFHRRFRDKDSLEPAGQGSILFDMLAIFIQGRGPDAMQCPPR